MIYFVYFPSDECWNMIIVLPFTGLFCVLSDLFPLIKQIINSFILCLIVKGVAEGNHDYFYTCTAACIANKVEKVKM